MRRIIDILTSMVLYIMALSPWLRSQCIAVAAIFRVMLCDRLGV